MYANSDVTGSGGYGDSDVRDEATFAAAQLYASTGDAAFLARLRSDGVFSDAGDQIDWGYRRLAGALTLATVPSALPADFRASLRARIGRLADGFVADTRLVAMIFPMLGRGIRGDRTQ